MVRPMRPSPDQSSPVPIGGALLSVAMVRNLPAPPGGVKREDRRKVQQAFTQDKDVRVLIATDAATGISRACRACHTFYKKS